MRRGVNMKKRNAGSPHSLKSRGTFEWPVQGHAAAEAIFALPRIAEMELTTLCKKQRASMKCDYGFQMLVDSRTLLILTGGLHSGDHQP
jgi:hypothetical protein